MDAFQIVLTLAVVITASLGFVQFARTTRNHSESARVRWSLFVMSAAAFVWMGLSFVKGDPSSEGTLNWVLRFVAVAAFCGAGINVTLAKSKEREKTRIG
jgi:hypothetical protein